LALLERFQEECEERWMSLDLGLLVRAMVVFATGQSRFERVSTVAVDKLKEGWAAAKDGLQFAINYLRTNADIEDESLLSSPLFFITIAYFSYLKEQRLTKREERMLLFWLYVANARGRYSRGASETMLDADLAALKRGGGPEGLIEAVRQQVGRLNFEAADFGGRGAGSALFSLAFLALKAKGAKDWRTGLGLSLTHQGKYHYIQYHHIFPKALLKGKYERQEMNEIANMAFISGKLNRQIGKKEPAEYFPEIVEARGEEALLLQAIPLGRDLHKVENYRKFLEARRSMLAAELNAFVERARAGADWRLARGDE
jgi:hypothetical protein